MASSKPRKPLISPDALSMPATSPQSTINRVIQQDREASGRSSPPAIHHQEPEPAVNQPTSSPVHQLTSKQSEIQAPTAQQDEPLADRGEGLGVNQPTAEAVHPLTNSPVHQLTGELNTKLTPKERRRKAEEEVDAMGKSPMKQIGPRIPADWDEWLENYVHARRHSGLEKQKLIRDLVRNFIVEEISKEQ